jgi:hypothetical protein
MLPRLGLPSRRGLTLLKSLPTKPSARPWTSSTRPSSSTGRLPPTAAAYRSGLPCSTSSSTSSWGGRAGCVRGMKVREERILADRKPAESGGQVDELLGAYWGEPPSPGRYDFGDKGIDWGAVLPGDRLNALPLVRALTYGPEYAFALGCYSDGSSARFEWELDRCGLPVRRLGEECRAAFTAGVSLLGHREAGQQLRGDALAREAAPAGVGCKRAAVLGRRLDGALPRRQPHVRHIRHRPLRRRPKIECLCAASVA